MPIKKYNLTPNRTIKIVWFTHSSTHCEERMECGCWQFEHIQRWKGNVNISSISAVWAYIERERDRWVEGQWYHSQSLHENVADSYIAMKLSFSSVFFTWLICLGYSYDLCEPHGWVHGNYKFSMYHRRQSKCILYAALEMQSVIAASYTNVGFSGYQ